MSDVQGQEWKRVVIQKVDLDTAATALVLGVSEQDSIKTVRDRASEEDLADSTVLCIECGGSGEVDRGNFDHHDTTRPLPPATRQAFAASSDGATDRDLARLVEYVALLDEQGPEALADRYGRLPKGSLSLAGLFSGMLLTVKTPVDQLLSGLVVLRQVLALDIDPFGAMPELPEWNAYILARRENDRALMEAVEGTLPFTSRAGLPCAYLQTTVFGTHGVLYRQGYAVVVLYSPLFGDPPVPKYTIGGNDIRVDGLLPALNALEPGWGGPVHGTIIGSPRTGSSLMPSEVINVVCEGL